MFYKFHHQNEIVIDDVVDFVRHSHHMSSHQGKTPFVDPTLWQELQHFWNREVQLKNGIIMSMLFMDEETGRPSIGGIFACYFLPVVIVTAYWFMFGSYFNNTRDYGGEAQ